MSNDCVVKRAATEAVEFGKALRRVREAHEMTQEGLAHAAGLTTNFLSDVERGAKVPSLTTILKVAHGLGVPPGELFADFTPAILKRLFRN